MPGVKMGSAACLAVIAIFSIGSVDAKDLTDKDFPKLAWTGKCTDSWKQPSAPGADVQSKLPLECEAITLTVAKGHSVLRIVTNHGNVAFVSDTGLQDSKRRAVASAWKACASDCARSTDRSQPARPKAPAGDWRRDCRAGPPVDPRAEARVR